MAKCGERKKGPKNREDLRWKFFMVRRDDIFCGTEKIASFFFWLVIERPQKLDEKT